VLVLFKRNWREIEPRLEYKRTCYLRDFLRRKDNLSLESGFVKVGRQEEETQGGDAIYIPNGVAHGCRSTLKDQPLNVFCLGVAIPHDAQLWTEEDLPDAPI